jgi:ABC-type transporter Mla subunit MlaD
MISKEQKIRLGIFLVITSLLLVTILAVLIVPRLKEKGDTYFINFKGTSVNGVNQGAAVKYQGVKIGKVTQLEVNPENLDSVLIYVRIKQGFPVKTDMRAALQYAGITGMRFVEISGGKTRSPFVLPGGEIKTKKGLGEKAEDIVLNVDSVVNAVNDLLNEKNRRSFSQLLENLDTSSRVLADTLKKREKNLDSTLEKLDKSMDRIVEISKNLNKFSQYLNRLPDELKLEEVSRESRGAFRNIAQRFSKDELGQVLKRMDSFLETSTLSIRKIETRFHALEEDFSKTLGSFRESMENISRFTRILTEDPTLLLWKRTGKKRGKK